MKTWLAEPLLHFLVLGAALFGLYALTRTPDSAPPPTRITITAGTLEQLCATWFRQWQRPPTAEELQGLIAAHIREEMLYREALALGLDRDDTIVRRRLAQKFEFLTNDLAASRPPTDGELEAFFAQQRERYRVAMRLSFSHLYFSTDRRGPAAERDARDALARLRADPTPGVAAEAGDPSLLADTYRDTSVDDIGQLFGREFAAAAGQAEPGAWQGPMASSYGWHLVYVHERVTARLPELAEVREQVQRDWFDAQRRSANENALQRLQARYQVVIEPPAAQATQVVTTSATAGVAR
jgi:hypothetical protein